MAYGAELTPPLPLMPLRDALIFSCSHYDISFAIIYRAITPPLLIFSSLSRLPSFRHTYSAFYAFHAFVIFFRCIEILRLR